MLSLLPYADCFDAGHDDFQLRHYAAISIRHIFLRFRFFVFDALMPIDISITIRCFATPPVATPLLLLLTLIR